MITIEGIVEEIIFTNEANGYTVCEIRCHNDSITAVGFMPFINVGDTLKLSGKWVNHPDYGEQLKVETYEKKLPQTVDAIEKYLASGVIKGVGPVTARKIVERFGEETLSILQFDPGRLAEIKGISLNKAIEIGQAFNEQQELREVVMFFQKYGISPTFSAKIYKTFGKDTIEKIKENPYRLADEVIGIGFKTADRIAQSLGIDPASGYRICSGIKYVLSQAASAGHVFLPEDVLREYTASLLDIGLDSINDAIVSLLVDKSITVEHEGGTRRIYLSPFYYAETGVCRKLLELASVTFKKDIEGLEEAIDEVQAEEGIILAENQRIAVKEALTSGVMIITGGPGTGKTTIIKTIIKLLQKEGYDIALAAPTGRAAKRMTEATGFEARTIHRLLEMQYMGDENELYFFRSEANPIEADIVIIDEMSMVDVLLMNHLLKAIAPGTRLILVGDVDQLPSVGPGNVLKDIIASGVIKTVRLTEIFRQAEESMIIVNAHRVNRGEKPRLNERGKDFFFIHRKSGEDIVATIVELCGKRLPATYGYHPIKDIQVLTPTKKGITGVANLNIELQKALNPEDKRKNEKPFRDYVFREGDRVMQVRNNYNLRWVKADRHDVDGEGVFNGDTGLIRRIDTEEQKAEVIFEDEKIVEYDFSILDEIEPAFAVTIHKSQGSEFPVVVIPIFPGPKVLLTRNLLYTAITRAKELVILVGVERVLYEMIENDREAFRHSGLADKLRKCVMGVL